MADKRADKSSEKQGKKTNTDVKLSKSLSWLLRHGATSCDINLTEDGYIDVSDILRLKQFRGYTEDDITRVVHSNDKKRFTMRLSPDTSQVQIRASQGHSIQVPGLELCPILCAENYPVIIHGTYRDKWPIIKDQGLSRMTRNHIHMVAGEPGEGTVISGMRDNCNILIYIDIQLAIQDCLKFYLSANNVVLSPGDEQGYIAPKYFSKVIDRKTCKPLDEM